MKELTIDRVWMTGLNYLEEFHFSGQIIRGIWIPGTWALKSVRDAICMIQRLSVVSMMTLVVLGAFGMLLVASGAMGGGSNAGIPPGRVLVDILPLP